LAAPPRTLPRCWVAGGRDCLLDAAIDQDAARGGLANPPLVLRRLSVGHGSNFNCARSQSRRGDRRLAQSSGRRGLPGRAQRRSRKITTCIRLATRRACGLACTISPRAPRRELWGAHSDCHSGLLSHSANLRQERIFAAGDWRAESASETISPRGDRKSETATREKWPQKRPSCLQVLISRFRRTGWWAHQGSNLGPAD
jgi:hypothetical protein